MALVTPLTTNITIETVSARHAFRNPALDGLVAGEALLAAAPCYIHTDGTVHMSNGTADNNEAVVAGWTGKSYAAGEPVTLFEEAVFEYATGMTPGDLFYLGTTNGRIDDTATTGGTAPIAMALDAKRIKVKSDW